jgi:hypothetical protein
VKKRNITFLPLVILLICIISCISAGQWIIAEERKVEGQSELQQQINHARELRIEKLGIPVTSTRLDTTLWVPNPDGKTYDLLQIYAPEYGGPNTIIIMDLGNGEVKRVDTDRGLNFHLCTYVVAPNGKLYISVLGEGGHVEICIYDPAENKMTLKAISLPVNLYGETHPLVLGTDRKIYAFGSNSNKSVSACQIDPVTDKVTDYGFIGPSHSPLDCWAYSACADDNYLYIASGKVPWYLISYDLMTGKSETLLTTEKVGGNVSVRQNTHGCSANATKVIGTDGKNLDYWLYHGKAMLKTGETPPWPDIGYQSLPLRPEVSFNPAFPDDNGYSEISYRSRESRMHVPKQFSEDVSDRENNWQVLKFNVPLYPQEIYRLTELPDGRIFGTAGAYMGNFIHDPSDGKCTHVGKNNLSHYTTAVYEGNVYMSGYPSSALYVYDPKKPWTANKNDIDGTFIDDADSRSNPRRITYLNKYAGTHKMYASAVGADRRIYFGGRWMRNGSGGGLVWYDPKTGKADGFWEIFSNYQINYMTSTDKGKYIVISTMGVEDPLLNKPKPEEGKLFVFDTSLSIIVHEIIPVKNARGAGLVAGANDHHVLGWTVNPSDETSSILYSVDAKTGELIFSKTIPFRLPVTIGSNQKEAFDYRLGPDGMVWTFIENRLVRIDPKNGAINVVGRVDKGGRIAFYGNDVYLSGDVRLRKITGIVKQKVDAAEQN